MSTPQENIWHYTDGITSYGPLGSSAVRQMIAAGVIRPDFALRREGEQDWQHLPDVDLDAPPRPRAAPVGSPSAQPADTVVYHLNRNGVSSGPFQVDALREMVRAQLITPADLVWRNGLSDWLPVGNIPELQLDETPPPPPAPPAAHADFHAPAQRNVSGLQFTPVMGPTPTNNLPAQVQTNLPNAGQQANNSSWKEGNGPLAIVGVAVLLIVFIAWQPDRAFFMIVCWSVIGLVATAVRHVFRDQAECKWYYSADGTTYGPFKAHAMKELMRSNRLRPEHLVFREGDPKWKPLRDSALSGNK